MNRILSLLIVLSCSFQLAFSQITFQRDYDISLMDMTASTKQTIDNGYVIAGTANQGFTQDIGIIRTDTAGDIIWAKSYQGNIFNLASYFVSDIIVANDGNYIITGSRGGDIFLLKVAHTDGSIIWNYKYGTGDDDFANSVYQTSDNGYLLSGYTYGLSAKDSSNMYLVKVNSSGTQLWDLVVESCPYDDDQLYAATETSSGYLAVGYTSEANGASDTTTDIVTVLVNTSGTFQSIITYGSVSDFEEAHDIQDIGSGQYMVTGYTDASATGLDGGDAFTLKLNSTGGYLSCAAYDLGFLDQANHIFKLNSGTGYGVIGFTMSSIFGTMKSFLLKIDNSGVVQFARRYGSVMGFPIFSDGMQTADNGFVISSMDGSVGSWDYSLIKTNASGYSLCNEEEFTSANRAYDPASATPSYSTFTGGSRSNFSIDVNNETPTETILCIVVPCDTPTVTVTPSNPTICNGQTQTLTASGSNGSGSCDSWSWSTGETTASINVSPASQTTYTVTGYVGICGSNPVNVTVNVNPTPTPSISGTATVCENSTGEVYTTTNTGNTFTWTVTGGTIISGAGTNTITVTWGSAGGGNVSVLEDNGNCSATDNFAVTIEAAPTVNAGVDDNVCEGNSVTLTGTASNYSSLQWTTSGDGNFTASTSISTDYTPGSTDVTNTSATITLTAYGNGTCSDVTDNLTLTIIPNATVDAGTATAEICAGEDLQLNGSGTNYTGIGWTTSGDGIFSDTSILNPVYTPGVNDISNGTVTLSVSATNDPQCNPATDFVTVTINPIPNVIAGSSAAACEGIDINLTETGGDADTWSWTGPNSFADATQNPTVYTPDATASGWYIVFGSISSTSCYASDSVQVTVNPNPTIYISGDTALCNSDSTTLTASGADTYLWNTTDTSASITTTPSLGQTSYIVTGTNTTTSCYSSDTIIVSVYPNPTADAGQDTTICYSNTATLHGSGGISYEWSPTATLNDYTAQNPYATPLDTTMFYVTVTNTWGCSSVDSVTVNVLEGPSYSIFIADVQCPNGNDGSAYIGNMNGVNPISYSWSNSTTDTIISNITAGTYGLTITDGIGCQYAEQLIVNQPTAFADSTVVNNITCYGEIDGSIATYITGGTAPYTYLWNNSATTSSISGLVSGYYAATITDSHNCTYLLDSMFISQPATPVSYTETYTDVTCSSGNDGLAMVVASGGTEPYTYVWSTTDTTNSIAFLTVGTYYVTITDDNGCLAYDTVHITEPTAVVIHDNPTPTTCKDATDGIIDIVVTGGNPPYIYNWGGAAGGSDNQATDLGGGTYYLTVTDQSNCESTAEIFVDVTEIECMKIPEIISPNGDGYNETWEVIGISNYNQVTIEIYNRWGNKIFTFEGSGTEYTDPANQWDGSYKGRKKLGAQSFIYILDVHNGRDPYQGIVTVTD